MSSQWGTVNWNTDGHFQQQRSGRIGAKGDIEFNVRKLVSFRIRSLYMRLAKLTHSRSFALTYIFLDPAAVLCGQL